MKTQKRTDATTSERKRILSVTIKRTIDTSPDTSYLGEYSDSAESDYSFDRKHSPECAVNQAKPTAVLDQLERVISYLNAQTYDSRTPDAECESIQDAQNLIIEAQEELQACDCGESGSWERNTYRYFNPNWKNYEGCTPEEIREYCQQDYARMEALERQQWCYLGISVSAEVQLTGDLTQKVRSGGLWGIESDSDKSYFAEVEADELGNLKTELHAMGFSKRAITAAFRNVKRSDD